MRTICLQKKRLCLLQNQLLKDLLSLRSFYWVNANILNQTENATGLGRRFVPICRARPCSLHILGAMTSPLIFRANLSVIYMFVRFVLVWICRFPLPLGACKGLRFVIVALLDFSLTFLAHLSRRLVRYCDHSPSVLNH